MEQLNQAFHNSDNRINFRNVMYLFWENKYTIFTLTFIITSIALCYTYFKPRLYEANALIQVEKKNQSSLSPMSKSFMMGQMDTGASAQIALMHSRYILEPVIDKLGLDVKVTPSADSFFDRIKSIFKSKKLIIDRINAPMFLYPLRVKIIDNHIYQIIDSHQRILVTGVEKQLVQNKNKYIEIKVDKLPEDNRTSYIITKVSKTKVMKDLIQRLKIEELGDGSLGSHTGILQISLQDTDYNRLVNTLNTITEVLLDKDYKKKSLEAAKTLEFLKSQMPSAKHELEKAEENFTAYRTKTGKVDIRLEAQQKLVLLADIEKQLTQVKMQQASIRQNYTAAHPLAFSLREKIKQLNLQKQYLEQKIRELPASDKVSVNLIREIKVRNAIYLVLLNKIQELTVMKAATLSDVRILAPAVIPDATVSKQVPLVTLASILLGLILSSLFIIARKAFHHKINDPQWTEKNLNLSNFAIIPYSKQQSISNIFRKRNSIKRLDILAKKYPKDLSVEALRSLRTSFQIMLCEAENNIVSIMGVSQNIGKSFVSLNFAYLLSEVGKKVLLIDGDIRKGHLNDYFNLKKSPGLTELVNGKNSKADVIHQYSTNLDFISCGLYPANPSEILSTNEFKQLINDFSQEYDLVIIDTAPVLAVTDCILIGKLASMNFLIIGSDTHEADEIILAVRQLDNAGIKILGTIFNTLQPNATVYGNYRYKYTAYGSDDHEAVA